MSPSRNRRTGSEESFGGSKDMSSCGSSERQERVRGRGEPSCRLLMVVLLLACITGSVEGQCDGSPKYLSPGNSSVHVAFPEVNWDAHSNTWTPFQFYPTAVHCTWVIRAPAAHVLAAAFLHFDTEKDYDFVTIYSSEARTQQLLQESGDLTREWFVTSPEDTLVIDFVSDEYTTYYGFLLAYRYEPRACVEGGVTVTEEQLIALPTLNLQGVLPGPRPDDITSPGDRKRKLQLEVPKGGARWQVRDGGSWVARAQYPSWLNCTWRVAVSPRQVVELEILRYNTPERDLLTVWEVGAGGARPLMQHGGDDLPLRRSFRSSWPLLITFMTHSGEGGSGFLLDLTYITRACDPPRQELGAPRGLVGYPNYNLLEGKQGAPAWRKDGPEEDGRGGRAVYYGPDSCRWVLRAPPGYHLNLTVLHLDTRPQDPVKVVEGDALVQALSGGLPAKRSFVSQGSEVTLKFDPQEDTARTGFVLQYSWLLVECGGEVLVHGSGQVKSPYYPDTYGPNVTCQWKLTPPPGHLLHLLVTRLKLDAGDALQVKDGEKDLKVTWDPSSSTGRLLELHPDPSVSLFFSSDSQHNEGYFLIKYAAFTLGSCDFGLSPCGWTTSDPLQAWAFHPSQGMMVVAEESAAGLQLPRGYRAILTSPWVTPLTDKANGEPEDVCLSFDYLLDGPDAFLLSAWLVQETFTPLIFLHGPHGNRSLTAAVNFTISSSASFKVVMQYERGYGSDYYAGVGGVWVRRGRQCGRELDHLRATSCNFTQDLCGWTNTHTDHTNWLLTDQGVEAVVRGGGDEGGQQWADLTSPLVARSDLRKREEHEEAPKAREEAEEEEEGEGGAACLNLLYRVLSADTELRVVLRLLPGGRDENADAAPPRKEGEEEEEVLWSQGRVESPGVLRALVNLPHALPSQYQLVLRAVGVGGGNVGGGVAVRAARLEAGRCSGGASCTFDSGFCSWKVSYTGGTVWYIRPHEGEEGSHAAVLVGGASGDSTCLISETVSSTRQSRSFSFRYRLMGTSKCLSVAQRVVTHRTTATSSADATNTSTTTTTVIWSQCRSKGDHWLYECVTLPPSTLPYQVVLKATADEPSTEVWIDDVQLSSGACNSTLPQDTLGAGVYSTGFGSYSPLNAMTHKPGLEISSSASLQGGLAGPPQWKCEPRGSLCGMTQPSPGHRDWVYVEAKRPGLPFNATTPTTTTTTTTTTTPRPGTQSRPGPPTCKDGSPLQEEWLCDGVEDCPDRSDEEECECQTEGGEQTCGMAASHRTLHLGSGVCAHDAFFCTSGRACPPGGCEADVGPCLPRTLLCDLVEHCVGGEDEAACVGVSRTSNRDAARDADEPEPAPPSPAETTPKAVVGAAAPGQAAAAVLECSGGLLVPLTWRCDGRKDCPLDGLDEMGCAYCSAGEFICPHSGVCVPRGQVCDGSASIPSCTDELFCEACPPAHFACDVCVPSWRICDGVWNCENGEDERECTGVGVGASAGVGASVGVSTGREAGVGAKKECTSSAPYRCLSGRCLPESAVCDRRLDCPEGEDEKHCRDDNFDVPRYVSVKPLLTSRGQDGPPSRLVTPPLEQSAGMAGVLAFRYRLDTWIGPSNLTLSVEMVGAEDPTEGVRAWALWRQSGHKGREWLTENVVVPPMPGVTKYKLAFLLSDHHHHHHHHHHYDSQQVHLSHLSFRVVQPRALNPLGAEMLSCDFPDSLCGWSQPSVQQGYSWVYARASPHARHTGPITGYPGGGDSGFVFADSLYGSEGSTADLLSPPMMLPSGPEVSVCFRFALFLYGSQVSQVSVLALQHLPSRTHATQLYRAVGGRGLSWVPAGVTVRAEHVVDVAAPFVLAVRARRGQGPEGDIALDHLSVLAGPCHLHPSLQPNLTLHPTLTQTDALALTAGPALTPLPALDPPDDVSTAHPSEDTCTAHTTCSSCVVGPRVGVHTCTWCDLTQRCVGGRSPAAAACPPHLAVHHNTSEAEERRGPGWCPRLTPQQNKRVLVAAGSSPVLSFPVSNIQATQTDSGWTCVFESITEGEEEEQEEGKKEGEEEDTTQAERQDKTRMIEDNEVTEGEGKKQREEEEKKVEEGEGDFDFKRRRREERKSQEEGTEVKKEILRLPAHFQGRVLTVGEALGMGVREGVGVGVIHCGDGVSQLQPAQPRPRAHYSVTLVSPAGAAIDNPERVRLVVYSCGQLASSCSTCAAVNATYSCGWCVVAQACTIHAHCPGASWVGPGRSCDLEEQRKTQEENGISTGLSSENLLGLGEPLQHIGEEAKSDLDLDLASGLLGGADEPSLTEDEIEEEDEQKPTERKRGKRKKAQQQKNRSGGREDEEEEENEEGDGEENDVEEDSADSRRPGRVGGKKRAGRKALKGKLKVTGKGRSFLRLPQHPGLYVARNTWRLHTGRQYYIPVSRKTLINLGFVRQVTFGSLAQEKTRTVLINGAWKKAAGYYVDLYEKVDNPPVTSLITTSRSVFEQLMTQLSTEQ